MATDDFPGAVTKSINTWKDIYRFYFINMANGKGNATERLHTKQLCSCQSCKLPSSQN